MTKENTLFAIVGLLLGLMIGFFFANAVNQGAVTPGGMPQNTALPSGHPSIPGGSGSGTVPEVQAAIDKARQNPNDFEAQMKAAELYYQIQRFEGAVEFMQRAHELQPDNYEVLVNLANVSFDAGRYEDAERSYIQALAKKPQDGDVRTDLGLTFIFRSVPDYDRAIQEFKRVLEINPNHIQALQNLTVAYTKKSDTANANATLARLEQTDSTNAAVPKLREEIRKLGSQQASESTVVK